MPDRSKVTDQTKSNPPVLQVGGFAQGQQPCHLKTFMLRKQQRETRHLRRTGFWNPHQGQE